MSDTTSPETTPEPANLDDFNLDDFLDGITVPKKTVPVCKDRVLGQKMLEQEEVIDEAAERVDQLERQEAVNKAEGKVSRRRITEAASPELLAARAELETARATLTELEERARGAFFYVRVEPLTRKARQQAAGDAKRASGAKEGDLNVYNDSCLSLTARLYEVDPRVHEDAVGRVLLPEQWSQIAERIGIVQYESLVNALAEVSVIAVSPDFSQPASPSADGATPSSS